MTAADVTPTLPPGRYGRRREPARARRRWVTAALALMVVVAGLAITVKLYRQYAQAPYQVHRWAWPRSRCRPVDHRGPSHA